MATDAPVAAGSLSPRLARALSAPLAAAQQLQAAALGAAQLGGPGPGPALATLARGAAAVAAPAAASCGDSMEE